MMGKKSGLVVGLWLAACAREAPRQTAPPADPAPRAPILGEPCALSSPPRTSTSPPRIYVEFATLQGDLAAIQQPNAAAGHAAAPPRTFSQMLADQRWEAISVRHMIAADGVRETFPWEFEPPPASTGCPAGQRWDISVTPHVSGRSPVTVSMEVQLLPVPPPGTAAGAAGAAGPSSARRAWQIAPTCGARTTLVVRNQQLIVLTGFPVSASASVDLMTTVTPYVIWEDADLERLLECKRKLAQTNRDVVRAVSPQAPAPGAL